MDKCPCDSKPCGQVAYINGMGLSGGDMAERGMVQEMHKISLRCHFVGTVSLDMR